MAHPAGVIGLLPTVIVLLALALSGRASSCLSPDRLGSITGVADATGQVQQRTHYTAFGQPTASDSSNEPSAMGNEPAYTGREYDQETGLYYYRARYYRPAQGKFLSEDPIGFRVGDFNLGRYVGNDPLGAVRPSGYGAMAELAKYMKSMAYGAVTTAFAGILGRLACEMYKGNDFEWMPGGISQFGLDAALGAVVSPLFTGWAGEVAKTVRHLNQVFGRCGVTFRIGAVETRFAAGGVILAGYRFVSCIRAK